MTQTVQERDCIRAEMEYREWRECPQWYCVKTTLHQDGTVESKIVADEKTNISIALQCDEKPLDEVFETMTEAIYYTYHAGYEAAVRQMAAMNNIGKYSKPFQSFAYLYSTTAVRRLFLCRKSY